MPITFVIRWSELSEGRDRMDPCCAQRRNQRRTCACRNDAEQADNVGDRIENAHDRTDQPCRRRRQQRGTESSREAAAEEQPDADGASGL